MGALLLQLIQRRADLGRGLTGASALMEELENTGEDVFGLWDRSCALLDRDALLVEPAAASRRALALICYYCAAYHRSTTPDDWVDGHVKGGLRSVMQEEICLAERKPPEVIQGFEGQRRYWFLTRTLGIDPERAWHFCMTINTMHDPWRKVFVAVARARWTFADFAKEHGITPEAALSDFHKAVESIDLLPERLQGILDQEGSTV